MALLALIYFIGVEMSELTPEQIAIVKPFLDELEVRFFDMAGRLNEQDYLGEFQVEAYKASFFIRRENGFSQYLVYKYIRQKFLSLDDMVVSEEFKVMNQAVIFGMNIVKESISK